MAYRAVLPAAIGWYTEVAATPFMRIGMEVVGRVGAHSSPQYQGRAVGPVVTGGHFEAGATQNCLHRCKRREYGGCFQLWWANLRRHWSACQRCMEMVNKVAVYGSSNKKIIMYPGHRKRGLRFVILFSFYRTLLFDADFQYFITRAKISSLYLYSGKHHLDRQKFRLGFLWHSEMPLSWICNCRRLQSQPICSNEP
jgi:hypothetical protein